MSNSKIVELIKEKINYLDKQHLILILLNKEANIFGEASLQEKCDKMSEEELREKIINSFERGYDAYDVFFADLLKSYIDFRDSGKDNSVAQVFVDDVMEHFDLDIEKYEEKKRRQKVTEILSNELLRTEIKEYISELLINDDDLDNSDHNNQVEHVFLYVIYQLLYVTLTDINWNDLVEYQKSIGVR